VGFSVLDLLFPTVMGCFGGYKQLLAGTSSFWRVQAAFGGSSLHTDPSAESQRESAAEASSLRAGADVPPL
jgi:hypothetical protein